MLKIILASIFILISLTINIPINGIAISNVDIKNTIDQLSKICPEKSKNNIGLEFKKLQKEFEAVSNNQYKNLVKKVVKNCDYENTQGYLYKFSSSKDLKQSQQNLLNLMTVLSPYTPEKKNDFLVQWKINQPVFSVISFLFETAGLGGNIICIPNFTGISYEYKMDSNNKLSSECNSLVSKLYMQVTQNLTPVKIFNLLYEQQILVIALTLFSFFATVTLLINIIKAKTLSGSLISLLETAKNLFINGFIKRILTTLAFFVLFTSTIIVINITLNQLGEIILSQNQYCIVDKVNKKIDYTCIFLQSHEDKMIDNLIVLEPGLIPVNGFDSFNETVIKTSVEQAIETKNQFASAFVVFGLCLIIIWFFIIFNLTLVYKTLEIQIIYLISILLFLTPANRKTIQAEFTQKIINLLIFIFINLLLLVIIVYLLAYYAEVGSVVVIGFILLSIYQHFTKSNIGAWFIGLLGINNITSNINNSQLQKIKETTQAQLNYYNPANATNAVITTVDNAQQTINTAKIHTKKLKQSISNTASKGATIINKIAKKIKK